MSSSIHPAAPLLRILQDRVLPLLGSGVPDKLAVTRAHRKLLVLPPDVTAVPLALQGKRVALRSAGNFARAAQMTARWPRDGMQGLRIPKMMIVVAWYRLKFNHDQPVPKNENIRLYFGAIEGHAEIYLNGRKVLTRTLPADFKGWDQPLSKSIKTSLVPGENILMVKVTSKSDNTASGIFKGAAIVAGTHKQP